MQRGTLLLLPMPPLGMMGGTRVLIEPVRGKPPAVMSLRERLWERDDAVSPVVGMILVLGISIVGIAAILYWGLPAIDEMKANVEHRSLESQFRELDATI